MESLDRSKAIIDVGRRIVGALQLGDDLTAQWMAHLVAERIAAAEHASSDTRDAAVAACVEAIQKLWANRYTLPAYMRPLRELDPLLHTLKHLGVDEAGKLRFLSRMPHEDELEGASEEERKLFEFAIGIDHSARELIRYFLSAAAERSTEAARPWIEEAIKGDLDVKVELVVSKFVADGLLSRLKEEAQQRAMLARIEKLESFSSAALSLAGEMRKALPPGVDTSEG